jgi:deoxyribodipyrimidine photo-lyase
MTVIWWIRRDLRLTDNPALQGALQHSPEGGQVVPVFILDPRLLSSPYAGEKRLAFLWAGLHALDAGLRRRGSGLVLRRGDPLAELSRLAAETGATAIYAEPDVSPYARRRDAAVSAILPVAWSGSPAVRPPGMVLKPDGAPYTVFTPFSKAWKALPGLPEMLRFTAPEHIPTPSSVDSLLIPETPGQPLFPAGEAEAQRRLAGFLEQDVYEYSTGRDRLDLDQTSQLSPYLRFGMLSPRQAVSAARGAIAAAPDPPARQAAETWLNELIWRDFYLHILYHFPRVRRQNFRLPGMAWQNNPQHFAAWCAGQTGYPVVDAAMRQLVQTGWMPNRARMIVASFLTKDLLVDWRWGERFFMQHLVDGDPAANNGGWQWTAGTGTDAAPYFRIFSPLSQGQKHDPQGRYIRRWLPELANVPEETIHAPWQMPEDVQRQVGCRIGYEYPAPVVDHAQARQRALQAYGHP